MNRRTGKIARFPKDLREVVNRMLDDGAQYASIINELQKHRHRWPDHVDELTINNLSTWHAGGYQDWVRQQEISADLATRNEFLADLLHGPDPNKLHETILHLGIAQTYHVIAGLNRDAIEEMSTKHPAAYARLLTVFQQFSQHALTLQKLKLQAAQQGQPTSDGGFVPKALPPPPETAPKSEQI